MIWFGLQALIKQTGEAEWAKMSERERQARLMKIKLQERKLRQENKFDEAGALLSQGIKDQSGMMYHLFTKNSS